MSQTSTSELAEEVLLLVVMIAVLIVIFMKVVVVVVASGAAVAFQYSPLLQALAPRSEHLGFIRITSNMSKRKVPLVSN